MISRMRACHQPFDLRDLSWQLHKVSVSQDKNNLSKMRIYVFLTLRICMDVYS